MSLGSSYLPRRRRPSQPTAPPLLHTSQAIQLTYRSASLEVSIYVRPLPSQFTPSLGRDEQWAARRDRLRRLPPRVPPSQLHPPRAPLAPPPSSSSSSNSASTGFLVPYTNEFHRVTVCSFLHVSSIPGAFPFSVIISSNPPLQSYNKQKELHLLLYWPLP